MVTRLPDPPLVTDSMSSGGEPHSRVSMSAPGSTPVHPMPQDFEILNIGPNALPQDTNATPIPVSNQKDRYQTGIPRNADRWQPTATHGGSYEGTSYSDADQRLP